MLLRCVSRLTRPAINAAALRLNYSASSRTAFFSTACLHQPNRPRQSTSYKRLIHNSYDRTKPLDLPTYDHICSETLESLTEFFEQAVEDCSHLKDADVTYGDGVLSIHFGSPYGSYVINRQRPNLQIWLSSPTSGPKRYDFIDGRWIYKHDGVCLHDLLAQETSEILKTPIDLSTCAFYKI
ncbi:frataxin homolog, mitochondrial [Cloeon dipterum]|uniref:frataxin homolog, mitochondrial n=1 Tax=Cloeon dipterum TaxID=197152 RepID=UPI00321FDC52